MRLQRRRRRPGRHRGAGGEAAGHGRRAGGDRLVAATGHTLVSLAAGITTAFIEARVPDGIAVVSVMPNTPALVDEGMAAISPGTHCDDDHLRSPSRCSGRRVASYGSRRSSRTR